MCDEQKQTQLFDLATGTVMDAQDRHVADHVYDTSDVLPAIDICAELGTKSVIKISFDKFSDGRGFSYARRIRESGFVGGLVASGHVIADQADYLRRCGFSHAEIPTSKTDDWQTALSSIPAHFQHMETSPRGRVVTSA